MDDGKSSQSNDIKQRARLFQRRDGSWAAVFVDDNGVDTIAKAIIVPYPSAIDRFEDQLQRERKVLQDGIAAGVIDDAFALFDYRVGEALEALRQALKP